MLSRLAVIVLLLLPLASSGQSAGPSLSVTDLIDSLHHPAPDSLAIGIRSDLDSLQLETASRYQSLKHTHDSLISRVDAQTHKLNHALDSLERLQLPTGHITSKLDSLQHYKDQKLGELTTRMDQLKSEVKQKMKGLDLPPELQSHADQLTSLMDRLDLSLPTTDLPLSFQNNMNLNLGNLSNPLDGLSGVDALQTTLPDVSLPNTDLGNLGDQLAPVQEQLGQLPTSVDDAGKLVEQQIVQQTPVGGHRHLFKHRFVDGDAG